MKQGLTKIVLLIDRSGSMQSILFDMIGGINSFLNIQRENKIGTCKVSAYKFNTLLEPFFEWVDINDVKEITAKDYIPSGSTALLDATADTIKLLGDKLSAMAEEERPEKVLFVIITDGEENSSVRFKGSQIKNMIEHQQEKYSWEFVYIGANQDAWAVGDALGAKGSTKLSYVASAAGVKTMFDSLSAGAVQYRSATLGKKYAFSADDQQKQDDLSKKAKDPVTTTTTTVTTTTKKK